LFLSIFVNIHDKQNILTLGLRKLLDEQQDIAKEEGGVFVNCSDWQPCPKGVNETAFFFHFLASTFNSNIFL
jgi:hypothetical protein